MPMLESALKALECISKNDITILMKMLNPPEDAKMVLSAVCILMNQKPEGKMDPNTQMKVYDYWPTAIRMMNQDNFLKDLKTYKSDEIPESMIKALQEFLKNPKFELNHLKTISEIAANLASWVIAIDKVYIVNLVVKPK